MTESLITQSKELLQRLSQRKFEIDNFETSKTIKTDLLKSQNNIRRKFVSDLSSDHKISDSIPNESITSIVGRSAFLSRSTPKRVPFGFATSTYPLNEQPNPFKNNIEMFGYDWIVSMLENKSKEFQLDKPEDYFDELDRFRRANKQYCFSNDYGTTSANNKSYTISYARRPVQKFNYEAFNIENVSITKDTEEQQQPPVYAYTLNERLFPVPLNMETAERGPPDPNNPHIIKVSIPSNRFIHNQDYSITHKLSQPTKQLNATSKNVGESLSLISHCLQSKPVSSVTDNLILENLQRKPSPLGHEPAGLRAHLIGDSPNLRTVFKDPPIQQCFSYPKSEQEAIDQLTKGKSAASLRRTIPSSIVDRSLKLSPPTTSSGIYQTRITRKEICVESDLKPIPTVIIKEKQVLPEEPSLNTEVPIPSKSVSRINMARVYKDQLNQIWESTVSN